MKRLYFCESAHTLFLKGENMKAMVIRKASRKTLKKHKTPEELKVQDIFITVIYQKSLKRAKKLLKTLEYDCVFSCDFKELNPKSDTSMSLFASKALEKIASRHGICLEEKPIGVKISKLSEKNKEILIKLALCVRFMTVYTEFEQKEFDFLMEEAGISPVVVNSDNSREEITAVLGEDFLIKCSLSGKTYYDVSLALPKEIDAYNLPEAHSIFLEYIKANPDKRANVKIRELMSK